MSEERPAAKPLFGLGQTVMTRAVAKSLNPDDVNRALWRHHHGDWGELGEEDRSSNELALEHDLRLFSVYHDGAGTKFYVITEWDRSVTTVLLPEDY